MVERHALSTNALELNFRSAWSTLSHAAGLPDKLSIRRMFSRDMSRERRWGVKASSSRRIAPFLAAICRDPRRVSAGFVHWL